MPKVSIIIPVYQAEDTIAACLDSVVAQTLDELEVLLVDDHGGDGSIDAVQDYIDRYAGPIRFRVLATETNSGPGVARNLGIRAAEGEYLAFLDSDDTLDPAFCQKLYEAAKAAQADLAFGHIAFDLPDGTSYVKRNPLVANGPFEGRSKRRYLLRFTSFFTTYLYRRDLLLDNGICFPNTHSAEDSCFLICALLSARRIACVDEALYHYHIQATSVSQKKDPARWKNRLASFRVMKAFSRQKGLYRPYRGVIHWMFAKKGYLMAAKDFLKNNLR